MILIRRSPWLPAGLIVLLVCTITAAFMVAGPAKKIQTKAAAALNPFAVLKPQGNGYTYRRTITIDHTKVPNTDQSNFPVLISGTYSYLATVPNGGNLQNGNGYDVIFTSDSGCSAKLNHEVETYSTTTGAVNYWVKVPALSHTTDTPLYICYGNAGVNTDQSNKTGVWDANFKAVWHVPNGSALNSTDSTAKHDLSNNSVAATTGKVDGGASFDGSTQYLSSAASADFNWANLRTVEFWMKLGNTTQTLPRLFSSGDGGSDGWSIVWIDPASGAASGTAGKSVVASIGTQATPSIQKRTPDNGIINAADVWHQVAVIGDGATVAAIYLDGSAVTLSNHNGNITNTTTAGLNIGRRNNDARYFNGALDELRLSNAQRSADWIKTEYNNQSSPATFYSISPISTTYTYQRRITIDHAKVPNTDQSNFPVLISGTYPDLAAVANGGNVQSSNGYDVIFTSDCNCSAQLNHEVETYNAATGAVNYWVKVPEVSHTTDTVIYMCYGNAAISASQQYATGVWDANFKGIYHLKNGAALDVSDSTSFHSLTNNSVAATTGKVDGGGSFDGSTQYLSSAAHADFNWANLRAVEFWMKMGNTTQVLPRLLSSSDGGSDGWNITWEDPSSGAGSGMAGKFLVVSIGTQATPSIQRRTPDNGPINAPDVWHHVAVIGDGSTVAAIYLDGSPVTVSNNSGNITNTTTASLNIGRRNNDARYFNGALDELRFSNAQRSADWIKTEYNNQNSPSTFYSVASPNDGCNQPPVANAGGPYNAESGESIKIDASGSFDPDGSISTYLWNFGDGNTCRDEVCGYTYSTPGTYTVTVTVTDDSGATASATTTSTVTGPAPQANPGGPYSGPKQTPIQFQGDTSSGSITSYQWSFGDGSEGSGVSPTHTYASTGNYNVSLTVTDTSQGSSTAYTTANINTAPSAYAGGPYSGANGSAIQLNGSASLDPDGSITSYQWNFGDNTTGTGGAPIHNYASAGTYTAALTVTDNYGATATASATVRVIPSTDQPPIANPGGPYSPNAGASVQFTGSGSYDPDGTITTYRWDFGDGGTASATNPTHTFASPGSHLVSLTVTDNLGASTSKGIDVAVKTAGGNHPESVNDVVWDPSNRSSMDDPRNDRGNAANRSTGNNNFQIVAPVLSLPGRGLDLSLNLVHNALVWNKSGNEIFFDIDHDQPAPGWQLGFGKMVAMGTAGAMIIEPDGTRHPFSGQVIDTVYTSPGSPPVHVPTFKGKTTDGSLIEYRCEMGVNTRGVARYPNGTVVSYANYSLDFSHTHSYTYPYFIADANGNSISIKYFQDTSEPRIERIIDSVGRVIAFHYDSQKRLTSLSGPGLPDANGNATIRTFVRLHYKTQVLNLNGAFSGLSPRTSPPGVTNSSFSAIDAIYYPGTHTGYWFGASDSYSAYGMITRVIEERGMGFVPAGNPDEQGTVVEGTVNRQQVYSYPSSPSGLTAAPTYNNIIESWSGGTNSVTTTFEILDNSAPNERKVTIVHPDQTKTIQKSFNFNNPPAGDPNKFKDGAIKEEQSVDGAGHVLQNTTFDWEQGPDGAPRILQTNMTDERGQTLITKFSLYGDDNSIGRVAEYDYDGTTVIRTTRSSFTSYTDSDLNLGLDTFFVPFHIIHPRLLNLPQSVKTYAGNDGANKLASAVEFSYDEYATPLMAYPTDCNGNFDLFSYGELRVHPIPIGILGHSAYWNPLPLPTQPNCDGGSGSGYITRRGNATTIKTYADTSNPDALASPIIETRTYDMTGNVIATSKNCCEKTSAAFELAAQYAFPASQTRGATDPNSLLRVTTKATYLLATGLPFSKIDANGKQITFFYFNDSLRPKEISLSTGARITFDYDDVALKITSATRLSANGTITDKSIKTINGLGEVVQEQSLISSGVNGGPDVWDFVDTSYDQLGRLYRQSRPYRIGDAKQWKETIYDDAGRVSELREPYADGEELALDGTVTRYFYNESTRPQGASSAPGQTTRIVDPWGRWRWARLDASGHLAEVVEPIPAASDPNVFAATKYSYDAVGNLIKVEQGDQARRFGYDSLGRLTKKKLAEAEATLNAAGERATTEPDDEKWSDVYAYDDSSNMTAHTDARGVRTNYSYQIGGAKDPLNRLQLISYDLSRVDTASLTVLAAPPVSYQYRTKTSSSQLRDIMQLEQVTTGATGSLVSTELFVYDDDGRPFEKRFTFGGRDRAMTITYGYDSLSRVIQTTYPEQYHDNVQNPVRKLVTTSYDESSRETGLKVNNVDYASQISYNPASQITSLLVGSGANQMSENYQFDAKSGLLTNQTLTRGATTLMNLSYDYKQGYCEGGSCVGYFSKRYSGQLSKITNNITGRPQYFTYDSVGRLVKAEIGLRLGNGFDENGFQNVYTYDRYGNRTSVTASNNLGHPYMPQDGIQSLSYNTSTNRITTSGFSYDAAGNQLTNGTGQKLIYDAANRLVKVKDSNNVTVATYTYGSSNQRLITQTADESSTAKTYYVWDGSSVVAEYSEPTTATMPRWSRNYIYFGSRLLATEQPNGSGGEIVRYHHPDQLGTRVVTNNADTTSFEQLTLAFGTALDTESTGATNRRFTSYDRSAATGLDYAVNRHYDSRQGRFTQPDPLGLKAASLADPQSLNMYSYVGNDPVNRQDPDGQFWGALIKFVAGLFHSLKPNIITGSFTYHNQPPISVSFTTDFRNMGVAYGAIGAQFLAGGHWLNPLSPQKNLCDYLESKMWDLFKSHDKEVGLKSPGRHRGKTVTDCFIYAQNVLSYAYRKIGRSDVADIIQAGFKDEDGRPEFGSGLAAYLVSLGWKAYYWNPDVKNPADGQSEHPLAYKNTLKTGNNYGVPVAGYVINYHKTNPAKNNQNEMAQFNELNKIRFGFGLAEAGRHNFLYSYGMAYEVHWTERNPASLYEGSGFYQFHGWADGLVVVPPCQ